MLDLHDLSTWALAGLTGLAGWVRHEFNQRPTRDELQLRLENTEIKIDNLRKDINEIKTDLKEINQKLDQFYD